MKHLIVYLGVILVLSACSDPTDTNENSSPESKKAITAFSFISPVSNEVIDGNSITVTIPFAYYDVNSLVADFSSTGKMVTVDDVVQYSGTTENDFTDSVIYKITAEDWTVQEYTVNVITEDPALMVYANSLTNITFPRGMDDSGTGTLNVKFRMAESELTNSTASTVLQWAYDNSKFSSTVSDHNGLDATTAKHGGRDLFSLTHPYCRLDYDGSGIFSVESGYENHPVTNITWYGAVMLCNWLTEMRDRNTDNIVYTNINTNWIADDTAENLTKNGYRLPTSDEWEFAARYLGTDTPAYGDLASEYIAQSYNGGSSSLTPGYKWTPGDYASGAEADEGNIDACQAVSVFSGSDPVPVDAVEVKSLGPGSANALGIFDMSGNVREWFFTVHTDPLFRNYSSGCWTGGSICVGWINYQTPTFSDDYAGFRLVRSVE